MCDFVRAGEPETGAGKAKQDVLVCVTKLKELNNKERIIINANPVFIFQRSILQYCFLKSN